MACRLIWSPVSRHDLRDLYAFIAESSPTVARKFTRRVIEAVERLADFPESGRMVPEFGDPAIRELIRKPCRIVYRLSYASNTVEIVRVWHSARGRPRIEPGT